MRASLTSLPRGRSCSFSAARRRPLLGGHEGKEVVERPPRLVLEPILENLQPVDPVQPEVVEGASHLTSCVKRLDMSLVLKTKRVYHTIAYRQRFVEVVTVQFDVIINNT